MRYYWFNRQELWHKAKDRYLNCGGKEEQWSFLEKAKNKYKKKKKKKKQKENMKSIDTET